MASPQSLCSLEKSSVSGSGLSYAITDVFFMGTEGAPVQQQFIIMYLVGIDLHAADKDMQGDTNTYTGTGM